MTAPLLYHVTASLDGFISGPDGDMDWLAGQHFGPNRAVDEVLPSIGALLIGHRTYHGTDDGPGAKADPGRPYGGAVDVPMFVLTRDDPAGALPGYTFVGDDVAAAVATARAAAADQYVAVLGATTARRCLEAGLLDEVLVHVVPVLLGDGTRLFERPGGSPVELEWIARSEAGPVTNLRARLH
jgi:dihydrofolate reductase